MNVSRPFFSVLISLPIIAPTFIVCPVTSWAATITTVAGNGTTGYSGDGGDAIKAQLNYTNGVAVDTAGNLFISDTENHRIRRVDSSGIITTVAGDGTHGYSGDGGLATAARLSQIQALAVDETGNLFIADYENHRIRRIDTSGIITTVAGNGISGYSGDGSLATNAQLSNPSGVAVDAAGNIFIADYSNYRVRQVDPSGIITTVAGNGISGYSGDGGPATAARLGPPRSLAVDATGKIFIVDTTNHRIRRVDISGIITTVAGNGLYGYGGDGGDATAAKLKSANGVAVDVAGNLFIADTNNSRIRRVDTSGTITTVAGNGLHGYNGDDGDAVSAKLYGPQGVAVDSDGNVFIADTSNNRIRKVWRAHVVYGNALFSIAGHTDLEVSNATVTLAGVSAHTTTTNSDGKFYIGNILPGTYTLTISEPNLFLFSQEITLSEESSNIGTIHMTVLNQDDFNQAMAAAEADKAAAIAQKDIEIAVLNATIASREDEITSMNTTVATLYGDIASNEQTITVLNSAIASMFTHAQLDQAVTEAEAARDEIIAARDSEITALNTTIIDLHATIDSMFSGAQLDQAVSAAVQYWDAMGDGRIGLAEAIHALRIVSGARAE